MRLKPKPQWRPRDTRQYRNIKQQPRKFTGTEKSLPKTEAIWSANGKTIRDMHVQACYHTYHDTVCPHSSHGAVTPSACPAVFSFHVALTLPCYVPGSLPFEMGVYCLCYCILGIFNLQNLQELSAMSLP